MMKKFFEKAAEKKAERLALGKKGFTLIELLAVIAIIAILVLIAAPSFLGYTKDAKVATMNADTKVLTNAALVFQVESDDDVFPTGEKVSDATELEKLLPGADLKEINAELKTDGTDGNTIMSNVQSLKDENIEKYVIDNNTGKVYYKDGLKGKDGKLNFGHGVKEK